VFHLLQHLAFEMSAKKPSSSTQTVQRIAQILRCFTAVEGDLGVMQISRETGFHKSTTSRLLSALYQEGFVEKSTETGKYRLGLGLVNLAGAVLERQDLRQAAGEHIRSLADSTQETINLAILDGSACINIETVRSPKSIRYAGQLGRRTPLHCTSTGKVLLAFMDSDKRASILADPLVAYTQDTIVDIAALKEYLAKVRQQDFAISREEFEEGLVAMAAPIRDRTGSVVAALSISGPTYRMGTETLEEYVPILTQAAKNISRQLGHIR
jgi:DNA-binding IclR family transcriptional regulator